MKQQIVTNWEVHQKKVTNWEQAAAFQSQKHKFIPERKRKKKTGQTQIVKCPVHNCSYTNSYRDQKLLEFYKITKPNVSELSIRFKQNVLLIFTSRDCSSWGILTTMQYSTQFLEKVNSNEVLISANYQRKNSIVTLSNI